MCTFHRLKFQRLFDGKHSSDFGLEKITSTILFGKIAYKKKKKINKRFRLTETQRTMMSFTRKSS